MTCSAARFAPPKSPTTRAPAPAWTASRSIPPAAASSGDGTTPRTWTGGKRHIVVDSMGLLLAVLVTAANVDDARAAPELFARLAGQPMGKVVHMYADNKYHNFALYQWVEDNARWKLSIVRRPEGSEGWVRLPIRWTVERTFAWLGDCRRLSKDREKSTLSSESFIKLAMIHLMLNRLEPKGTDAEFRYRPAA